jgi:predicted transcriptional regulator
MTIPPHWLDDVVEQALCDGCQEPGKLAAAIGKHDCFVAAVKAGLAEFERGRGLSQAQAVRQAIVDAIEWRPPSTQ